MTKPLLETRGLRKSFPVRLDPFSRPQQLKAVSGVTLSLSEGETLGLAGESGSGKSTLGKLILKLLQPDEGEILFYGASLDSMAGGDLLDFRKKAQMIFQDPYSSLNPRMRVGDIIGEPLAIHGKTTSSRYREHVLSIMRRVGLTEEHYFRYPHEFSGGQRQRVGIARALAVSPRLIVADEPVSALDLSIQAQILNLLKELKEEYSLSFIFIAHDLSVLRYMCERIAVMYLGGIVEIGRTEDVFTRHLHPYTQALLSAIPCMESEGRRQRIVLKGDIPTPLAPPSGCPFHTRCPYAQEDPCATVPPLLEEQEPGHRAACHFSKQLYR